MNFFSFVKESNDGAKYHEFQGKSALEDLRHSGFFARIRFYQSFVNGDVLLILLIIAFIYNEIMPINSISAT